MTQAYLAPVPDLFPSVLSTAMYRAGPKAATDFVSGLGYSYWKTLRCALITPDGDRRLPELMAWSLRDLARLLEADAPLFVTFADAQQETLLAYPLGQVPAPPLDPTVADVALTAMHQGSPWCVTMSDRTTCIAMPCYAHGTLDRPDLERSVRPDQRVMIEALERSLVESPDQIGVDPYQPPESACPMLLGAIVVRRRVGAEGLSALAWQRALYCVAYTAQVIAVFAADGSAAVQRFPQIMQRSVVPRPMDAPTSWQETITASFTRTSAAEQMEQLRHIASPKDWRRFLNRAYTQLGFGHPAPLHPKRLYARLTKYANAEALVSMTEMTKVSATSMSMTASTEAWLTTLRHVMTGVTEVIPDAPTVMFAASQKDGRFTIEHALNATLTAAQIDALEMVALWTAIQGEPIHDRPEDGRMLFAHVRAVIDTTAPMVAIPVYHWRPISEVRDIPDLHGIFLGIRYPEAHTPDAATWCAWVLAAQYLLSPLAAALEGKTAPYHPTDVEGTLDRGCRHPFDPPSAMDLQRAEWLQALQLSLPSMGPV